MNNEIKRELLKTMDSIATEMPDIILLNYYDKMVNKNKYVLSMFLDAYKTVDVMCYAYKNICISQTAMLLRQLLIQTTITTILTNHPELIDDYIKHYKFRIETEQLKKHEQIDAIAKEFGVKADKFALSYLDYGWIPFDVSNNCSEDGMIKYAGFEDILSWKKQYLDKFSHASYTSNDTIGKSGDFPILNNFMDIAAKLFDNLCVSFHNFTKFAFKFNGEDLFNNSFRPLYTEFLSEMKVGINKECEEVA